MSHPLAEAAAHLLRDTVISSTPLHGGDLSEVVSVTLAAHGTVVAKSGPAPATEGRMLRAIAATGAPAPAVLAMNDRVLVIEALPEHAGLGAAGWAHLGRSLRQLHASTGPHYGWPEDYAFGPVPIPNPTSSNWPDFWRSARLYPLAQALPARSSNRLLSLPLDDFLPASPPASLLHGDMWTGNLLANGDRISALIDPACYWGHGEVDLAMLCLFGNPPQCFWDAYGPLSDGWPLRRAIYQLWPALVHLHLFGRGYLGLVEAQLDAIP
ncbi:fructosamine kinase family protein [Mesobacterium sp. TK19101]|uniref:Fructosamine kinase family protein n=1 Tax=Mesobacterium hydrothermale TaxID=3111907 RepID=A0ABU6HLD1_9RHOB|nr:fructosamine kinase family protein [Mesobacterium sp. TK19101]MEC3863268.1 fructosamine kinase family protein [Mesobacterium sp. TK19101]